MVSRAWRYRRQRAGTSSGPCQSRSTYLTLCEEAEAGAGAVGGAGVEPPSCLMLPSLSRTTKDTDAETSADTPILRVCSAVGSTGSSWIVRFRLSRKNSITCSPFRAFSYHCLALGLG